MVRQAFSLLVTLGLFSVGCGGANTTPSSASVIPAATSPGNGISGALGAECEGAPPDSIVGTGPLTIERLRMDRQTTGSVSVLRQYACPGGTYRITPGETIELWAEWSGGTNPRIRIDWGSGEPNSPDATSCGSCLLRHAYSATPGLYRVTVTLDDRVSTSVTRTFFLDARDPVPTATVSISCTPVSPPTLSRGATFAPTVTCQGAIGVELGGNGTITGSGFNCSSIDGGICGPLSVPVGSVLTVRATGFSPQHRVVWWQGACAGIGTTGTYNETCTFTVTGNTTLSAVFQGFE